MSSTGSLLLSKYRSLRFELVSFENKDGIFRGILKSPDGSLNYFAFNLDRCLPIDTLETLTTRAVLKVLDKV